MVLPGPAAASAGSTQEEVVLSTHAANVVAKIRADHVVHKVRVAGKWFRRRVCALCGQPAPCNRLELARDIEAGLRDVAGNPVKL